MNGVDVMNLILSRPGNWDEIASFLVSSLGESIKHELTYFNIRPEPLNLGFTCAIRSAQDSMGILERHCFGWIDCRVDDDKATFDATFFIRSCNERIQTKKGDYLIYIDYVRMPSGTWCWENPHWISDSEDPRSLSIIAANPQ